MTNWFREKDTKSLNNSKVDSILKLTSQKIKVVLIL